MDIWLFVHCTSALGPNLFAEEQECVHQCRSDTGETQAIRDSESGRKEQWRVVMILLEIDCRICVEDHGHVVSVASVIEGTTR